MLESRNGTDDANDLLCYHHRYIIFPPGIDFSTLLGKRGVTGVERDLLEIEEEMEEEEEEREEEEEEEEETTNGIRKEEEEEARATKHRAESTHDTDTEVPPKRPTRKGRGGLMPIGTENSIRDAKEVMDLVGSDDGDGGDGGEEEIEEADAQESTTRGIKTPVTPGRGGGRATTTPRSYGKRGRGGSRYTAMSTRRLPPDSVTEDEDEDEEGDEKGKKGATLKETMKPRSPPKSKVVNGRGKGRGIQSSDEDNDQHISGAATKTKAKLSKFINITSSDEEEPAKKTKKTKATGSKLRSDTPMQLDSDANAKSPTSAKSKSKSPSKNRPLKRVMSVVIPPAPYDLSPVKSITPQKQVVAAAESSATARSSPSKVKPRRPSPKSQSPPPTEYSLHSIGLARTPSKRNAATKANQKLRDEVMPDVVKYQMEMKNKTKKGRGRDSLSMKANSSSGGDWGEEEDERDEDGRRGMKKRKISVASSGVTDGESDEESAVKGTGVGPRKKRKVNATAGPRCV